ncbi:MAG: hypothetical protein ACREPT_01215 [Rudaea sp.]
MARTRHALVEHHAGVLELLRWTGQRESPALAVLQALRTELAEEA